VTVDLAIGIVLAAAVIVEVACAIGLLLMRSALDRLHFLGPATIVGPLLVALASWLQHGADQASLKASLVLILLVVSGPILSFVTARAVLEQGQRR
jgi:multicomponent Na+:H+ antiporter subunit G